MKLGRPYSLFMLLLVAIIGVSCGTNNDHLNRRISLWRKDKIPYGTYYAFENLKYAFPQATVTINTDPPSDFRFFDPPQGDTPRGPIAYMIISPQVVPDRRELNAMMNFVGQGNDLFISSFVLGDSLLGRLGLRLGHNYLNNPVHDSMTLEIYHPVTGQRLIYEYPGYGLDTYVQNMDSDYSAVLGRTAQGRPNFVKFSYKGGGSIYLHLAPLAFTNFFLLHKNNKSYYDQVLSYLPANTSEVKWDDYFRYAHGRNFSALSFILANPALRWAFWLTLFLFGFIYLFESKRRQRLITAQPSLHNSSLDFVRTIGRLYYQRRDHGDLANKMIYQFLDRVRTRYHLPTSSLDQDFIDRLTFKSGASKQQVQEIVESIGEMQENADISDEELFEFSKKMDDFNKIA